MKAVILEQYGDDPGLLQLGDTPDPEIGPNDVLIDVHAAGFNPFECKLRKGWLQRFYPFALPHVLGNDFAGVVAAKGPRVWGLEVGDRVYGMQETMRRGSYAERMAINADHVRRMPANLSFAEAASLPMVYETAWMGLVDFAMTRPGQLVLVHGASGGVGSAAVLLAKAIGARVAATCSTSAVDFVRGLGADIVIDYTQQDFTRVLQNVDVVFDPIGKETNLRSYEVMRRGATMLVVLREDKLEIENRGRLCAEKGVTCSVVAFEQRADVLDYIRPLFESGALRPVVTRTLPLAAASDAHRASDAGHARGKTVLTVR
jgi:NADPH:quinone reductase-like Zn-dependent oxidoreductase